METGSVALSLHHFHFLLNFSDYSGLLSKVILSPGGADSLFVYSLCLNGTVVLSLAMCPFFACSLSLSSSLVIFDFTVDFASSSVFSDFVWFLLL